MTRRDDPADGNELLPRVRVLDAAEEARWPWLRPIYEEAFTHVVTPFACLHLVEAAERNELGPMFLDAFHYEPGLRCHDCFVRWAARFGGRPCRVCRSTSALPFSLDAPVHGQPIFNPSTSTVAFVVGRVRLMGWLCGKHGGGRIWELPVPSSPPGPVMSA